MRDEEHKLLNQLIIENTELKSKCNKVDKDKEISKELNELKQKIDSIPKQTKDIFDNDPKRKWSKMDIVMFIICIIVLLAGIIPKAATFLSKNDDSNYFSVVSPFATLIIGYLWGHRK